MTSKSGLLLRLPQFISNLQIWIVFLLIVTIPSNWFLKFWPETALVRGLLSDYLLPKLYLTDIFIFLIWLSSKIAKSVPIKLASANIWQNSWLITGLILIISQGSQPLASLWFLIELFIWGWLAIWLRHQEQILASGKTLAGLIIGLFIQLIIGGYQFFTQKSLFGYNLLGEPNLQTAFSLDRASFNGVEKILPYGTLPHPNVLAGVIVIYGFLIWVWLKKYRPNYSIPALGWLVFLIPGLTVLFTTQSWSAWLALAAVLLVWNLKPVVQKIVVWIVMLGFILMPSGLLLMQTYLPSPSISRRVSLNQAAVALWQSQPWWGIGPNAFTSVVETVVNNSEVARFLQPTHHLGLLILAEWGIIGSALLIYPLTKSRHELKPSLIIIILIIGSLDHYFYTLHAGWGLLVVAQAVIFAKPNRSRAKWE